VADTKKVQTTLAPRSEKYHVTTADRRAGKYLVFGLGREEFGISVVQVREIMGIQNIIAIPHAPDHMKGVINLRGKVIPVMDLRLKFGFVEIARTEHMCIIVVQLQSAAKMMGIVVDGVAEVVNIATDDIEDTPKFGPGIAAPYLLGIAKFKGKVKILLDVDKMLSGQESPVLESALLGRNA
jgi:purine-binding chemotaxis protein CheW